MREAIDLYGPGGNVVINGMITNPAVDFFSSAAVMTDEVINYGTGFYCR